MFTDTYFPQVSGVATSIKILADELRKKGHDVTIFTTTDPKVHESEEDIVRIASIPFMFFTDRRVVIGGMNKAYKIAKEKGFDIVHTHTEFGMGLIGKYVAYRLNIPTVHTYHTMYEKYLHYIAKGHIVRKSHVKSLSYYFCQHTAGVIAPGKQMYDTLKEYEIETAIDIIPTGVTIPQYTSEHRERMRPSLQLSENDIVLLSLSRLAKEKSLDKLLTALPSVLETYPNAKLVFVGDGPAREELEELTHELCLEKSVMFVGEIPNDQVYKYYQMADIYVNASETETQGLTYLEALVNKLPVIAKRNDYLSGIITHEILGKLYDNTTDLSQCIIEYIPLLDDNKVGTTQTFDDVLHQISADAFGDKVIVFYHDAIDRYREHKSNTKNPKASILNKLSFTDWSQWNKWYHKD